MHSLAAGATVSQVVPGTLPPIPLSRYTIVIAFNCLSVIEGTPRFTDRWAVSNVTRNLENI